MCFVYVHELNVSIAYQENWVAVIGHGTLGNKISLGRVELWKVTKQFLTYLPLTQELIFAPRG
jgi:hypothetical protein